MPKHKKKRNKKYRGNRVMTKSVRQDYTQGGRVGYR